MDGFTEGDKRICSPDYSQTNLLHCSLQRNTLATSILVTWYWIALQATLHCIVLQHSSLCTQFCAWSSWPVVRVSFWEWSLHLDSLHSLPLYPTTELDCISHLDCTSSYYTYIALHCFTALNNSSLFKAPFLAWSSCSSVRTYPSKNGAGI